MPPILKPITKYSPKKGSIYLYRRFLSIGTRNAESSYPEKLYHLSKWRGRQTLMRIQARSQHVLGKGDTGAFYSLTLKEEEIHKRMTATQRHEQGRKFITSRSKYFPP